LLWNYRGYGLTPGSVDPTNLCIDIEQILFFLRIRLGLTGKIGVYGRSLGCVSASHLAGLGSKHGIDMVFLDRGFCDMYELASEKFYSPISKNLLNFGSGGWQANNSFKTL
jgi:pimeloyl-ACP methyl ester carboxylesterase